MDIKNIEEISIEDILPYANNPRKNQKAINAVVKSIEKFGCLQPIILDADRVIICGHTRYEAAKQLGLKTVPCAIAKMTDEQARAFRLADNKVSEYSLWIEDKLIEEIEALPDMDLSDFGFMPLGDFELEAKEYDDGEIEVGEFEDEKYRYKCPCCGFRFNA